jgi:hypothetical protein
MSETPTTPFSSQCEILGELWLNYRNDEEFADFIEYNDVGLPLAYFISNDIVATTPRAEIFIGEAWNLLLEALGKQDLGWENLDELLDLDEPID